MMPYWLRIAIGAGLGAAAGIALWLFVGIAWVTATGAALLAAIGFLGSYFVWSADRLPEYEQVLFDRPNTIVAGVLVVAFALAGVGTGLLGGDAAPPTPAESVSILYARYQNGADAFVSKTADGAATTALLDELAAESQRLAPEIAALPDSSARAALIEANEHLASAIGALKACVAGESAKCLDARISAADAVNAIERAAGAA